MTFFWGGGGLAVIVAKLLGAGRAGAGAGGGGGGAGGVRVWRTVTSTSRSKICLSWVAMAMVSFSTRAESLMLFASRIAMWVH